MSKVSSKRLAKLAARIVRLDPEYAVAKAGRTVRLVGLDYSDEVSDASVVLRVDDITALAASVLSQSEMDKGKKPMEKPKKSRSRK